MCSNVHSYCNTIRLSMSTFDSFSAFTLRASLPDYLKSFDLSFNCFRQQLKTFLFSKYWHQHYFSALETLLMRSTNPWYLLILTYLFWLKKIIWHVKVLQWQFPILVPKTFRVKETSRRNQQIDKNNLWLGGPCSRHRRSSRRLWNDNEDTCGLPQRTAPSSISSSNLIQRAFSCHAHSWLSPRRSSSSSTNICNQKHGLYHHNSL